ncbi:E3 ubiquitin-protein ligase Ufd4-like isoform X2 [Acropora muricata]|uniref:E3 ubiquitin-protein ligase Ufd4-like isoform X2 n=1 Tax=Acropora muricata TaxID=159855 RepID=UPI0034E382E7
MEKKHRTLLRTRKSVLEEDLEPNNILSKLATFLILNETEDEDIRAQPTRQKRCERLLDILPRKGPNAFTAFLAVLLEEAPHLALCLIEADNKEEPNQSSALMDRDLSYNCPRCEGLIKERDSAKEENESLRKKSEELENKIKRISEEKEKCEKARRKMKTTRKPTNTLVTEPTTGLQARVDDLENTVKKLRKQMSDLEKSSSEAIEKEKSKFDSLEEKVRGLKLRLTETIRPGSLHIHSGKDFDKHGVVYALQNKGITATRSSGKKGQAEDILKNEVKNGIVCATKSVEDSWWCVDLTENYALYLTHYTLRHGQEPKTSILYNWQLEGSVDGCKWTVLKKHTNDRGLITSKSTESNDRYSTHTWEIDGELKAFRYFQIFQTGFNYSGKFGIFLSGIELYGVLVKIGS